MSAISVPHSLLSSRTLAIAAGTLSLGTGFVYLLYRCWNRSGREREGKSVSIVQTAMNGPYSFLNWLTTKGPYDDMGEMASDYIAECVQKREFGFCIGLAKTTNASNESGGLVFFVATKLFDVPTELLVTAGGGTLDQPCSTSVILGRTAALNFLGRRFADKRAELATYLHLDVESLKPSNKGGSSGGLAAAISFLSLALEKRVKKGVAVTGAIASNGDVKPVSGIGQKVTAAVTSSMTRIIMPKLNEGDFKALQIELSAKIKVIYVSNLDEAYANVFGDDDDDDTF
ncbi:hypothetical protein niasHS_001343 [Heterodera schachtii]|uniref:Lon proteolytic domain-containing protein n=1 Tax=Heterodera schachtii TaxID=97005 RepID=A0ABD2KLB7_HETSC